MPPKQPPAQPKYEEQPSDTIPVTGPVTAGANAVQKLSRIPTDKLLVLFVCFGFGFLLYEDKREGAERAASQMRSFEDSRESDRKFHEQQREKDRTFFAREREADRAAMFSLGQKLEAIERAVRAKTNEDSEVLAPMPKLKGAGGGGGLNVKVTPAAHVPEPERREAAIRLTQWLGGCFHHDFDSVYCLLWG